MWLETADALSCQILSTKYEILAAASLPAFVSSGQRFHVLKAHLLQRLCRQRRASASAAVADNRLILVRGDGVDLVFQLTARQRHGAGDRAFRDLVRLANVNQGETFLRLLHPFQLGGIDLFDLALGCINQLLVFGEWHTCTLLVKNRKF